MAEESATAQANPFLPTTKRINKKFIYLLFFTHLFLSLFFLDTQITPNPTSRVLPVLTFFEEGHLQIDTYKDWSDDKSFVHGHFYSDKPPLPTFIVIPFYGLLRLLHLDKVGPDKFKGYPVAIIGDILCGVIPFVLMIMITFFSLNSKTNRGERVWLSALPFYASFLFVFAGTFFAHTLAALFLLLAYLLIKKQSKEFWVGIFLGLSVLCEFPLLLIAPFWVVMLIVQRRYSYLLRFLAGLTPPFVLLAVYNILITGSPFTAISGFHANPSFIGMQQNYGFRLPSLEAMWGLSFSFYRGLFIFAPVLFLVLILFLWKTMKINSQIKMYNFKLKFQKIIVNPFTLSVIPLFLLISAHFTWWGGWSYGPRYITAIAVLGIYESCIYLQKEKISLSLIACVSLLGIIPAWMAKVTDGYMLSEQYTNPIVQTIIPHFISEKFLNDNILTMMFHLRPNVAVYSWPVIFILLMFLLSNKKVENKL
jgi:hypothetical protein